MPWYEIHTEGVARSVYKFEADNEVHARERFNAGDITEAEAVEVDGEEIMDIEELET